MEKISIFTALLLVNLFLSSAVLGAQVQWTSGAHFVLVHGSGHGGWCWYKVTTVLQKAGFTVTALDMTSDGKDRTNPDTVSTIAHYAKPLTDFLASLSGQVVLVGHSMAGNAMSYAMELHSEKISKAVFVTSLMPVNGQSGAQSLPTGLFEGLAKDNVYIPFHGNGALAAPTSFFANPLLVQKYSYNESPKEDITLALSLLGSEPMAPFNEALQLTPEKYGSIPRYYVRTTKDNIIPITAQEFIINANPPKRVFSIDGSDHCPFFSKPQELSRVLIEISKLSDSHEEL